MVGDREAGKSSFFSPSLKDSLFFLVFADRDICQLSHYSSIMPPHGPERLCKQEMLLLSSSAPACRGILSCSWTFNTSDAHARC